MNISEVLKKLLVICLFGVFTGCTTYHSLNMKAYKEPVDKSVISPKLKDTKFSKVMIIPPSGTARGAYESQMTLFEQEFLRQGMTVISSAITGKVVMDTPNKTDSKNETASSLSDLERALIMAKETGADLILQLGEFHWYLDHVSSRFFITTKETGSAFKEVTQEEFNDWKGYKVPFVASVLSFKGKVINVSNGEILATLSFATASNFNLDQDYIASYSGNGSSVSKTSENFVYSTYIYKAPQYQYIYPWENNAKFKSEANLIADIAKMLSSISKENQ